MPIIFVTLDEVATLIAASGAKAIFIGAVKRLHPGGADRQTDDLEIVRRRY